MSDSHHYEATKRGSWVHKSLNMSQQSPSAVAPGCLWHHRALNAVVFSLWEQVVRVCKYCFDRQMKADVKKKPQKTKMWLVEVWLKRPLVGSPGRSLLCCLCFCLTPLVTQNFFMRVSFPCSAGPWCLFLTDSLCVCHPTRLSGFSSFCHSHEAGWAEASSQKCQQMLALLRMPPLLGGVTSLSFHMFQERSCGLKLSE